MWRKLPRTMLMDGLRRSLHGYARSSANYALSLAYSYWALIFALVSFRCGVSFSCRTVGQCVCHSEGFVSKIFWHVHPTPVCSLHRLQRGCLVMVWNHSSFFCWWCFLQISSRRQLEGAHKSHYKTALILEWMQFDMKCAAFARFFPHMWAFEAQFSIAGASFLKT